MIRRDRTWALAWVHERHGGMAWVWVVVMCHGNVGSEVVLVGCHRGRARRGWSLMGDRDRPEVVGLVGRRKHMGHGGRRVVVHMVDVVVKDMSGGQRRELVAGRVAAAAAAAAAVVGEVGVHVVVHFFPLLRSVGQIGRLMG